MRHILFFAILVSSSHALSKGAPLKENCLREVDSQSIRSIVQKYAPTGKDGGESSVGIYLSAPDGKIVKSYFERNAHRSQPIASTQKILTAYTAYKSGSLNRSVRFSDSDLFYDNQGNRAINPRTQKEIQPGESMSLSDFLGTLILRSSNGAAFALARGSLGSVYTFVDKMNDYAYQFVGSGGQSYFQNPAGLTDSDADYRFAKQATIQKSTAAELSEIAAGIMADSGFRQALQSAGIAGGKDGYLYKLGFTRAAGRTLVTTFPKKSTCSSYRVVMSVFGSSASDQFSQYSKMYTELGDLLR